MLYVRKFLYYFSLFAGIAILVFILFHAIPSDPARIILGANAEEAQAEALRKELGLDQPLYIQLVRYIADVVRLDFGRSYIDGRSVFNDVSEKLRTSLVLLGVSFLFTIIYTVIVISAYAKGKRIIGYVNFLFVSTPTFFAGILVAMVTFLYYPYTSFSGDFRNLSDFLYMLPPGFVLAIYPMAILSRLLVQEMDNLNNKPFIISARAKGLSEFKIRFKHILRNALIPYLAALSNQLPMLFTGAFIIEIIFSLPGIGSLLIKSILQKDFPMLEGIAILNGLLFVMINLAFEVIYPVIDPRVRD